MSSIPNGFPISLRSWASHTKNDEPKHLPTIIQRINFERGGFHNITEESLRKEIADAEVADGEGDGDGDGEESEDEGGEQDRAKELVAAREEMVRLIDQAHSAAMLCTEVVSAALSKEMPVQAVASMSPELKNLIGTGTLGLDKLAAPRTSTAQREANKKAARGWQIQGLNRSVDRVLQAAERLRGEVESETVYWGEVLGVEGAGWGVCRVKGEGGTLGIRFGSSEASPAFRNRSLGALRRNEDGSIVLDQGLANSEPQILRVRIKTGEEESGISEIPQPVAEGAPIESLILEARNTIFAQELWLELNRESRTLGAYGVRAKDGTLTLPFTANKTIILDLIPLGTSSQGTKGRDDELAEGISVAFQLFLSLAHRHSHRKRSQAPVAKSTEKASIPLCNLMRPFLTRIKHQETIQQTHSLLKPLCQALSKALPKFSPQYTIKTTVLERMGEYPMPEQVLMRATYNLEAITTFEVTDDTWIKITARTQTSQIGSYFTVEVSEKLGAVCPPPEGNRPFATFGAVRGFVEYATSCGLAVAMVNKDKDAEEHTVPFGHEGVFEPKRGWQRTSQANMLKITLPSQKAKQLAVYVHTVEVEGGKGVEAKVRAAWEWVEGDVVVMKDDKGIEALLKGTGSPEKGKKVTREIGEGVYEWSSREIGAYGEVEVLELSLEEVLGVAGREEGVRDPALA